MDKYKVKVKRWCVPIAETHVIWKDSKGKEHHKSFGEYAKAVEYAKAKNKSKKVM